MPKTKTEQATKTVAAVRELNPVLTVEAIKVTTIKKSFVKQMPGVLYADFVNRIKQGTIKVVGLCRNFGDHPDCLVLQLFDDDKLCTLTEINYREYLSVVARMDLELTGDDISDYVNFSISKVTQLFLT